jgi:hypothetical protein
MKLYVDVVVLTTALPLLIDEIVSFCSSFIRFANTHGSGVGEGVDLIDVLTAPRQLVGRERARRHDRCPSLAI